jgi:hypothetical protein
VLERLWLLHHDALHRAVARGFAAAEASDGAVPWVTDNSGLGGTIMRTLVIVSACTVAAANCIGMAAAKDLTLTRDAQTGVETRIAYERAWDHDCKALPTTVTVTQPPKNGVISVVQGTSIIPASTPNAGSTENCAGKTVTGNEVHYKSNAGFQGTDSVTYSVTNNNVPAGTRVITIVVK